MKLFQTQWLVVAGAVGLLVSNLACGGGGSGGSGGTTGAGGAVAPRVSYPFDTATDVDTMNWKLNDYVDGNPSKNLGAYMNGDAGLNLASPPSIAWADDDSEGSATSGSLKVTFTFTAFDQYVDPSINVATPVDLTGAHSVLKLKVKLVSGSLGSGGLMFHISSGVTAPNNYVYASAPWKNGSDLVAGTWTMVALDASTLSSSDGRPFDPTQIVQIGIQFASGSAVDGGAPPSGPIVIEIDTIKG